jgi:predicted naringenin-chalcone synthase
MFIIGIGTAAPPKRYTQVECWRALQDSARFQALAPRSRAVLHKILSGDNGIASRHLALDRLEDAFHLNPDALHDRFQIHAPRLAVEAGERALIDAQTGPAEIDALLVSTCTGYLCPGLTSYVSERLGLRADVLPLDLVGQGCGAALPNLRISEALLSSGRSAKVLSVCVEICSAAFYLDDDPGVLVSACLFGDGAAAVVTSGSPGAGRRVRWRCGDSLHAPNDRESLRFDHKSGMLRNILSPQVPSLAAWHAGRVLEGSLARLDVARSQVAGWVFHPGGRDVLVALREQLQLSRHDLRWSEAILQEYGNVSSPSVLFVLQAALHDSVPGGLWWMSSFGAGFSCHGALLEVE